VDADDVVIPDPALVALIGPSGAGKSTWAGERYRAQEIVSSDRLRAIVGSGEHDLDASLDAFSLLDQIAAARAGRGLTVVIDTLGFDAAHRGRLRELARTSGLPAVAVVFTTPAAVCRDRNRMRDVSVPAAALTAQLRRVPAVLDQLAGEGWDLVLRVDAGPAAEPARRGEPARRAEPAPAAGPGTSRDLEFILQVSRFGWGSDPAGWLKAVTLAAAEAGFSGIALMDHLIQIPQVGRAWEPIPEPWVTLGLLAGLDTGLRLGTLVTPVTFRPAGVLAKTVATLDVLSGGRAFCGVGAGWWDREHAAYGLPFPPAGARLDQLEATIELMRALWQPGTKPYRGNRVALPETTCYPRPAGPVQIIVGGSGERRTLEIAARLGDGCNLPSDAPVLEAKIAVLRAHCERVGRDPAEVAVTVLDLPIIGRDRDEAARIVERLRGRSDAGAFARRHHAGLAADHRARYAELAARGVRAVFVALPDLAGPDDLERMAPVVSAFG
jgi:alkanesulfonate monooxygenase SsuD/methylene tetrahydromethanopterin reductase-like flavin-dependent oxidoreductase (luciferase family)/predicted kinase